MKTHQILLEHIYESFNRRDIDEVLKAFHPQVDWPNGWEGGYVHGHQEVRDYWTRQWQELDPIVTPVEFSTLNDGRIKLKVQQQLQDKNGTTIAGTYVFHTFRFEAGLIKHMEITME